jgi:hypothetical protein
MKATNKLRFVERKVYVNKPARSIYGDGGVAPELVKKMILQQWWEGLGPNAAINYAHPDAHKLRDNPPGEWRDVPVELEA